MTRYLAVSSSSKADEVHVFSDDAVHGPRAIVSSCNTEDPRHQRADVLLGRPRRIGPDCSIPLQ
jgi:hypothetical protein